MQMVEQPAAPIEILIYTSFPFTSFPKIHISPSLFNVSGMGPST